jgi:proteasome lid subunit RPN8/RPN11
VNLILEPSVLEDIIAHARQCHPKEGCGLVAGAPLAFGRRFLPMRNVLDSDTAFNMDPQELINALRDLRNAGEELIAIYHSHPFGPAKPSPYDVERAYYPKAAQIIVSLADPLRPQTAAFRIIDGEVLEVELRAIV